MLFKDLMSNVNESVNESNSSSENPIMLDELEEDEIEHDPFEFPHDDEIPFSRLLSIQFGKFKGLTMMMQI